MRRPTRTIFFTILTLAITLPLFAACGIGGAQEASGITIHDPWARSDVAEQNSAAFMEIVNEGDEDDRLIGADADIAVTVEVHEVNRGHDQVMRMREIEAIEIPAGERVVLEPGGLHVMFFGLHEDLEPGDTFTLTLEFENAGLHEITVEVRERPGGQGHGG